MGRNSSDGYITGCGCLAYPIIAICVFLYNNWKEIWNNITKGEPVTMWILFSIILFVVVVSFIIYIWNKNKKFHESIADEKLKQRGMQKDYEKQINNLTNNYEKEVNKLKEINKLLDTLLQCKNPFKRVGEMVADYKKVVFDKSAEELKIKKHPAMRSAERVSYLSGIYKENLALLKEMLYKYEFLLSIFPELKQYVDDEQSLLNLAKYGTVQDVQNDYDRVRDYVSKEEYMNLSSVERNQMALDRYKNKKKSDWQIGAEYEMYCNYVLRKKGFSTIDFGIRQRLEDLGRDIIAQKDGIVYIIQCKRWSTNRLIHENVICQLYGTTIEYQIKHQGNSLFVPKVVAVLYTTGVLSDMAKEFAKRLNVIVRTIPMGDYPMIKCNINNNGNKIYHLPFDQQYYSARINKPGEFYAMTVKEAEDAGFRRAYRWLG